MEKSASCLTDQASHFEFGKNWAAYSALIDDEKLALAIESLRELVPNIAGKRFLDIGSGSGLFSVAALSLGASAIHAVDIDPDSVETTRRVLAQFASGHDWTAEQASVFELSSKLIGQFDVVYSWGVLHHTGDMWRAIDRAAQMVAPRGVFAFSLYERSPLCGAWRLEKRLYMRAPQGAQRLLRSAYKFAYLSTLIASGRRRKSGSQVRGMDIDHDIHDWLGGFPYQSTTGEEVRVHMDALDFERVLERRAKVHLAGVFGTGCSEYVYRRSGS